MRFSSILALLSGSHVICAPSFLPFVPPIFSSSTAPHSPSSSLCRSSFSNLSTPPGSSLSLARLLALPHLPRGTSASPSLSFPVLLFRGHVRLRPPRAPTRPPLFFSPALLFCSPPLFFSTTLFPFPLLHFYSPPHSPIFPKSAHFPSFLPFFPCPPASHNRSSPPLLFLLSFHSYVCRFVKRTLSVSLL